MSSTSEECFLILRQMSIVRMVLLLLKMDVREEIKADIITANIRPATETGVMNVLNVACCIGTHVLNGFFFKRMIGLSWSHISYRTVK